MVIHSITPPEMLMEQSAQPSLETRPVNGGYLEGHQTPGGFQMTRIWSTDPAMYLKKEYTPGSILPEQMGK